MFQEKDKYHLKDHWNINPSPRNGKKVPKGYANVRYVRHLQNHQNNNWTHNGFVVPRLVQEHLYEKVVEAVKSNPSKLRGVNYQLVAKAAETGSNGYCDILSV